MINHNKEKGKRKKEKGRRHPFTFYLLPFTSKGFSLIEFIVVLAIAMIVTVMLARFQMNMISLKRGSEETLRSQQEVRRVLIGLSSELRNAQTSVTGSYPLETVSDSSLVFFTDTTGDRKPERLRYFVDSGALKRGEVVPTGSPLAYDLATERVSDVIKFLVATTTPVFTYYDGSYSGSGSPLSSPYDISKVRMVGLSVTVDMNPNEPPPPVTVSTLATIRKLKDNQ